MESQLDQLVALLDSYGRVAVGYSGGVDSAFLAAVCARHLPDRAALIHLVNPFMGTPERAAYERDARRFGLPVFEIAIDPLSVPEVAANPKDRCYHCKRAGFRRIVATARERGFDVVVDGSNADDAGDFRPGMRALTELDVRSPLMETGWHKTEEREMLKRWGFEVWNMPAGACLATRIPCGEPLDTGKLELVRACEDALHAHGLKQVRVRLVAGTVRIEASDEDLAEACAAEGASLPQGILDSLRDAGAASIDPVWHHYARGSMNA
ncbi:ATP-dependent sacrificial sulfur transferase LarE [Collinsella ihumii]|uniref:ATP-dependent sacrificial sulfur transferase LarE n=1 Tax=Collinsella ihumii TaxID=1720204 RepID=UPI0025AA35F7|nr:ATP-dependent sacrificial sulfur transferase LarE [Collinsella ihumii]MDN0054726.1 ATP-dependent sacrificial sulfur transferase LarE [Collinsella ihumii]